jgi:hypothetical protein
VLLTGQNNQVVSCKNGLPPHGFDLCDQIWDLTCDGVTAGGCANQVPGMVKCERASADVERQEGDVDAQRHGLATQMTSGGFDHLVEPEE